MADDAPDAPAGAPAGPAGHDHPDTPAGKHGEHGKDGKKDGPVGSILATHKIDKKQGIVIALTAAGVLLAYLTLRKTGGGSSAASGAAVGTASSAGDGSLYPTDNGSSTAGTADMSTYLQNLESEISGISASQSALATSLAGSTSSGTNASTSPYFDYAGAASDKYTKNLKTGEIDQVDPGGQLWHLTPAQWAAIKAKLGGKAPTVTSYGTAPPSKITTSPITQGPNPPHKPTGGAGGTPVTKAPGTPPAWNPTGTP